MSIANVNNIIGNESEYRVAANQATMARSPSYSNGGGRSPSNSNMVSRGAPGGRDVNDYYYGGPSASGGGNTRHTSKCAWNARECVLFMSFLGPTHGNRY